MDTLENVRASIDRVHRILELDRADCRRSTFVKEVYEEVATAYLRDATEEWWPCFDDAQRKRIQDVFVGPYAPLPEALIVLVSSLKLRTRTDRTKRDAMDLAESRAVDADRAGVTARAMERLFEIKQLRRLFRILIQRSASWSHSAYGALEGALIQVMVSVPERVHNAANETKAMREAVHILPSGEEYFTRVSLALCREIGRRIVLDTKDDAARSMFVRWISKLCLIGRASSVAFAWCQEMVESSAELPVTSLAERYGQTLQTCRGHTLEQLALALLKFGSTSSTNMRQCVCGVLRPCLAMRPSPMMDILTRRAFCGGSQWAISTKTVRLCFHAVLSSIDGDDETGKAVDRAMRFCVQSWASPMFTRNCSFARQRHVTVVLVEYFSSRGRDLRQSAHISSILHGIQLRLDSTQRQIRVLGMIVASRFSKAFDPSRAILFDESDVSVHQMRSILQEEEEKEEEKDSKANEDRTTNNMKTAEEHAKRETTVVDVKDSESDHDLDALREELARVDCDDMDDMDDDDDAFDSDDSEASMEAYTLDYGEDDGDQRGDEQFSTSEAPTSMRDCMLVLQKNDSAADVLATLKQIPVLVCTEEGDGIRLRQRQLPLRHDVDRMAVPLLEVLMRLENKFALKSFETLSTRCSVAIVEAAPKRCARFLTHEVGAAERSIGDRSAILRIIYLAAASLSAFDQVKSSSRRLNVDAGAPSGRERRSIEPETTPSETTAIMKRCGKERRWGSGRRPPAVTKVNRFANVAGDFFFPLTKRFDTPFDTPRGLIARASLLTEGFEGLLVQWIETLGFLVRCARQSAATPNMAKALLQIVFALRYHEKSSVRHTLLRTIFCAIEACTMNASVQDVISDDVPKVTSWIELCLSDPNAECREEAKRLFKLLGRQTK